MANQFTKERGRELVGSLAFCLRADGPRRLLGWFNLSDTDKEALLKMLKSLFGDNIELDMAGLRKMVETFMDLTNPATVLDRDRVSWEGVANGKSKIQQLQLDVTGRRYLFIPLGVSLCKTLFIINPMLLSVSTCRACDGWRVMNH